MGKSIEVVRRIWMNTEVKQRVPGMANGINSPDVVIVEDNEDQANITKMLIEEYGLTADCITDSSQALNHIILQKPRVVILDLMMPNLDGLRLCKILKSTNATKDTRVIIYSGKTYDSDRRKALEIGADAFFTKPAKAKILISKIKELMKPVSNGSYQG
jgi:DNA-binding response OmpR family regulator